MSSRAQTGNTPRDSLLTEGLLRAFALLLFGVAVWRIASGWWADTSRVTLLLFLVIEGYTMGLVLFARRALLRDLSPLSICATLYAVFWFVFVSPEATTPLLAEPVGVALQLIGALWQLAAKITLGRSFGLLPAVRGLVTRGPYRLVRHPIYLGYLVGDLGFLSVNFSLVNLLAVMGLCAAQMVRIAREEAALESGNEQVEYRAYREAVRYRVVPFIY